CVLEISESPLKEKFLFYVVDFDAAPFLNGDACEALKLVSRIRRVEKQIPPTPPEERDIECLKQLTEEFNNVFEGRGQFAGEYKLTLKEGSVPHASPPRRIPNALQDKVKTELDRMEEIGAIVKESRPTEWVN